MKNFWEELKYPISYIREVGKLSERPSSIYRRKKALTEKEKLLKIVNTTYNKRWPDGRIYGLSKNGEYTSHSVSPYSKVFLNNIEDKIKPLVLALKDKGYLSISSCESHGIYFKRYVTLIFPSKETALEFQNEIPFKRIKFVLKHATEVLNNGLETDEYGNILNAKKIAPGSNKEGAVEYINCIAKRNYADAWLLEMIISDQVMHEEGIWKYFKNWKEIIFKKFFMESFTKKLTKFIKEKLKKNIY